MCGGWGGGVGEVYWMLLHIRHVIKSETSGRGGEAEVYVVYSCKRRALEDLIYFSVLFSVHNPPGATDLVEFGSD